MYPDITSLFQLVWTVSRSLKMLSLWKWVIIKHFVLYQSTLIVGHVYDLDTELEDKHFLC